MLFKKMRIDNIILFLFLFNLFVCDDDSIFRNWGYQNKILFSPNIYLISRDKEQKKYVAINDIEEKTALLRIPNNILFNIEKALDMINSKELKSQYEEFIKLDVKTYEPHHIDLQKEEIFLSYIFYLIQHEPELYNSTKFYEKYKLYISSIKDYVPKSPLFYTSDQIEYLSGTYLGKFHGQIKKLFQEEINIFKNESYYNKDIDFNDWAYYRLFTQNKGLEVLNHINMIPLFNFFERDFINNNARFKIEKDGEIVIIALKKIKKGEKIVVNSPPRKYVERIIFEGKLNRKLNYRENYIIPAFSPGLFYNYDLDDIHLFNSYIINLVESDFISKAIDLYKDYSKFLKNDGRNSTECAILLENVNYYKNYIDTFLKNKIEQIFDDEYDRNLIKTALKSELKLLEKSSSFINSNLEALKYNESNEKKENKEKKDDKKNTDL